MPLTKSGKKVLHSMEEQYGTEKGKAVFYASINKGKEGSTKWHRMKKDSGFYGHMNITNKSSKGDMYC